MADLSWPAVLAMVLYGLNTVLDAVFVGRFVGEAVLAGVSVAYPLSSISVVFGSLIVDRCRSGFGAEYSHRYPRWC